MYESAINKEKNNKELDHRRQRLPVGTGVHDISKFPIPALSNCTFSNSPGHAVSKHHKSLQQTYANQT